MLASGIMREAPPLGVKTFAPAQAANLVVPGYRIGV
jgi:hypothetical protein